jgi:hypothetical protein
MKNIDFFTFKVKDDELEKELWDSCFDNKLLLNNLLRQIGWKGGTIHQVIEYIKKQKEKWNNGGRLNSY